MQELLRATKKGSCKELWSIFIFLKVLWFVTTHFPKSDKMKKYQIIFNVFLVRLTTFTCDPPKKKTDDMLYYDLYLYS